MLNKTLALVVSASLLFASTVSFATSEPGEISSSENFDQIKAIKEVMQGSAVVNAVSAGYLVLPIFCGVRDAKFIKWYYIGASSLFVPTLMLNFAGAGYLIAAENKLVPFAQVMVLLPPIFATLSVPPLLTYLVSPHPGIALSIVSFALLGLTLASSAATDLFWL